MFDRINTHNYESERIEVSQRRRKECRKIGGQKKVPGHTLFSYNNVTGELKEAEYQVCDTIDFWTLQPIIPTRVIIEKNCIYRQSLNRKNVIRHLREEGYEKFT